MSIDIEGLKSIHKHECEATRLVADPNIQATFDILMDFRKWIRETDEITDHDLMVTGSQIVAAALTPQGDKQ